MTKLAMVGLVAVLAQVDLKGCGTAKVDGPKTPECPKGRYVVTVDQAQQPPLVSYRCEEPASPASPEPSASPTSAPSAVPSFPPTPSPSPSSTPTPAPSAPPVGECWTSCPAFPALQCPCEGTCPASYDHAATRVGVGETVTFNRQSNTRAKIVGQLSSKDQPPFVPFRGNQGEAEQWMKCAQEQDEKGYPPVIWFAAYPGTGCDAGSVNVNDCQVERPSRLCSDAEKEDDALHGLNPKDCRRPNGFAFVDIVGEGGGPAGVRRVCALPPNYPSGRNRGVRWGFSYDDWTRTSEGGFKAKASTRRAAPRSAAAPSCRAWDVTLAGARPIE